MLEIDGEYDDRVSIEEVVIFSIAKKYGLQSEAVRKIFTEGEKLLNDG